MKKNVLIAAIILISGLTSLNAQITITRQDFPSAGILVVRAVDNITPVDPGQPGLNKTWDFSNLVASQFDSVYYSSIAGAPGVQNYPDANIATYHNPDAYPGGYNVNYWNFSDNSIKGVGDESLINLWATLYMALHVKYTPSAVQLPLPFTYNNSNSQSFVMDWITTFRDGAVTTDSSRTISHTTMNILADASGTMILPDGSFPVLRVKETWSSVDSSFSWSGTAWSYESDTTSSWTQYRWYANNFGEVGFYSPNSKRENGFTFFKSETLVGVGDHQENLDCILFPNPVASTLNIKTDETVGSVVVMDQTGKLIMQFSGQKTFDVSSLPSGTYLIKVTSGNKTSLSKITKL